MKTKTLQLTLEQAQSIYKTADASVKEILESNFCKQDLIGRPIGVWCLTSNDRAVKAENWNPNDTAIGVGVITEDTAFIVSLKPQAALPFGSIDVKKYDDIVYDEETYDNHTATTFVINAHSGIKDKMWDNDKFPFTGAPAAEYCIRQLGALPTLATAKEIANNIKAINEAMLAVGGAVVCGCLWTSTVRKCNNCAFVVRTYTGIVDSEYRLSNHYARAVSAFHFENFNF